MFTDADVNQLDAQDLLSQFYAIVCNVLTGAYLCLSFLFDRIPQSGSRWKEQRLE